MSHELIYTWLGLEFTKWPPDHYRLLGLPPGEANTKLIEERVHQRLDTVRRYQMMHPELATEAMNRLAQAFVCLTEPASKKVYDATLLGLTATPEPENEPEPESAPSAEEAVPSHDPLAWLYAPSTRNGASASATAPPPLPPVPVLPPPLPGSVATATPPPTAAPARAQKPAPPPPAPAPAPPPVDPLIEAAQHSPQARRGLGTKRALYYRLCRTRELVHAWNRVGKFLSSPRRRIARQGDAPELIRALHEVEALRDRFPPLIGEAGQPGYLILTLAQLATTNTFQTLAFSQRQALSRDWQAGLKLLTAHREFLRQELRVLRKRNILDRMIRAVRYFFRDQPAVALLVLLALLALNVALYRTYGQALLDLFSSR